MADLLQSITRDIRLQKNDITQRHNSKLHHWIKKYNFPAYLLEAYLPQSPQGVVNLSDYVLPSADAEILSLGLKYRLPGPSDIPRIIAGMSTFTFDTQFFKQTKGSPMGSPLSTVVAEVVMRSLDQWITSRHSSDIFLWRRYIDDTFCLVPSKVKVNSEFYIECVLKPVIEQLKDLYPGEMDKVFLHHDKASSHTSNKTQQFLQEMKDTLGLNFIRNSDIPVKSPDASPLDFYGFGMLKQRLFNRRPKTEAGLWKAAQEEWSNVSLSKVKEVFAAWKVRCREIAKKKGKHIEHMKKIHVRKIKF
ncbi:hypothetical protein LAZ67_X004229 [Cordylochernes scorpioides]|uniref:Reverse transcriptase n=1 Tax=Cordylochernes scorpioides TaxID=51811 RepID=A0ABY6LZM2_9ARAC|nr:hypothetical protein LAZ67_X004229 [Cordylochernes scorpioides]